MYTHTYLDNTYVHIYIYTYVYTYIYGHMFVYIHRYSVFAYVYIRPHTHVCRLTPEAGPGFEAEPAAARATGPPTGFSIYSHVYVYI